MFIGGITGLIVSALVWYAVLSAHADPRAAETMLYGGAGGFRAAEVLWFLSVLGTITLGYGALSTGLALFMGRRSGPVLWMAVLFQLVAAGTLVLSIANGGFPAILPLAFTLVIIALLLAPASRDHYASPPGSMAPAPRY